MSKKMRWACRDCGYCGTDFRTVTYESADGVDYDVACPKCNSKQPCHCTADLADLVRATCTTDPSTVVMGAPNQPRTRCARCAAFEAENVKLRAELDEVKRGLQIATACASAESEQRAKVESALSAMRGALLRLRKQHPECRTSTDDDLCQFDDRCEDCVAIDAALSASPPAASDSDRKTWAPVTLAEWRDASDRMERLETVLKRVRRLDEPHEQWLDHKCSGEASCPECKRLSFAVQDVRDAATSALADAGHSGEAKRTGSLARIFGRLPMTETDEQIKAALDESPAVDHAGELCGSEADDEDTYRRRVDHAGGDGAARLDGSHTPMAAFPEHIGPAGAVGVQPWRPPLFCARCHTPLRKFATGSELPCRECDGVLCEKCCEAKRTNTSPGEGKGKS